MSDLYILILGSIVFAITFAGIFSLAIHSSGTRHPDSKEPPE